MEENKSQEEKWDELIEELNNENFKEQKEENEEVIANKQVDWTAVIKAAKVANQNEKERQETAANERISDYKQRTQTRAEQTIQRAFHRKPP